MPAFHLLPHTRVPSYSFATSTAASQYVARELDKLIRARNAAGKATVLGLATGSVGVGIAIGAVIGIPAAIVSVYLRYKDSL